MKKIIIAFILSPLFIACNGDGQNTNGKSNDSSDGEKGELDKKMTKRDYSITPAVAYNNIFFDSAAMEKFFIEEKASDVIIRRMRSFYNSRNYQYAWFTPTGLTEQARGFWNLHNYQTTYSKDTSLKDKALQAKMDDYAEQDEFTVAPSNKGILQTELKMTQHFIMYSLNSIEDGFIKRKEMERFIPRFKVDPVYLGDSLVNKKHKDGKYYGDVNKRYKGLQDAMAKYLDIQKAGGWPVVDASVRKVKAGSSSPAIVSLKRRLHMSGDMPANDTSAVFNDTLKNAIMSFQSSFGYTADGSLSELQVKDMNVPVTTRIEQILVNMGRMQWLVNDPSGRFLLVNIPEFILHATEDGKKVFDMNVVVGKEGHNTVTFTGMMNQVVFAPYWNVPVSIVKKELMPKIASNPGYLESQNMEINGDEGGVPSIRQKPGPGNSLGKVKFLFPNSYNIYFHDTPAKSLFSKDKRAYSHGCIRLSDPEKMANYVLQNNDSWTPEKISEAMNAGEEKFVKISKPIPVLITYYTAWVDESGKLHFADDIYDHDKAIGAKMFINSSL
ncbi:MAG: L,D-transpeptidase family protein [Ferruginibacter sp.]